MTPEQGVRALCPSDGYYPADVAGRRPRDGAGRFPRGTPPGRRRKPQSTGKGSPTRLQALTLDATCDGRCASDRSLVASSLRRGRSSVPASRRQTSRAICKTVQHCGRDSRTEAESSSIPQTSSNSRWSEGRKYPAQQPSSSARDADGARAIFKAACIRLYITRDTNGKRLT